MCTQISTSCQFSGKSLTSWWRRSSAGHPAWVLQVLEAATGIALSSCICYLGQQLAVALGFPSASISIITILTVVLATCMPKTLAPLVPSSEGIAYILLQVLPSLSLCVPSSVLHTSTQLRVCIWVVIGWHPC